MCCCLGHEIVDGSLVGFNGNLDAFRIVFKAVHLGGNVRQGIITGFFQNVHTFLCVAEQQCIVVASHNVVAHGSNLEHLGQLFRVTRNEIQKGQTVKVLGSLIRHFDNLVVTLPESFGTQFTPNVTIHLISAPSLALSRLLQGKRTFHGNFNVTTCECQSEARLRILDKMKGNFRESLGLQIRHNGTSAETRLLDHFHHQIVTLLRQGQLEASFRGIYLQHTRPSLAIQTPQLVLDNTHGVDGLVERTNGTYIARWKTILDVMQRRVHEHLRRRASRGCDIPSTTLDAHIIGNAA
mmetsp:Transcript_9522/g.18304  ORF Transcript_9522/g.18304 Transcript_9522/m.18304 type:complete len:295 (+) Transcript_9522:1413-2297(+)